MTSQAEFARKMRQLDHDVVSLYEILARVELTQGRHGQQLDDIGADVSGLQSAVTGLTTDMTRVKGDVTGLTADVAGLKGDVTGLKDSMDEVLTLLRPAN